MKKATPIELWKMLYRNPNLYGSVNHKEIDIGDLSEYLLRPPNIELHYNIVGNCIFIFKPETK